MLPHVPRCRALIRAAAAGRGMTDCPRRPYRCRVSDEQPDQPHQSSGPEQTFADLGLAPQVLKALADVGYETPSQIQALTIPPLLEGRHVVGLAQTGTGKTAAFALPILSQLDFDQKAPQALVLAPTRELALQVANDLKLAAADRGTRVLTVYGGVGYEPQLEALDAGVDVVVGTPGRLLDLANRRALDLSHVKSLVLDEADEMLDLGFLPDVERLIAKTPETRQTMLFSATMPGAIVSLARTHMRHPMNIRAESSEDNQTVPATAQFVYQVHDLDKPEMLARILQAENVDKVIVFTRTKRQAQRVAEDMTERGFDASPLHGDMQQVSREKALKRFRDGKLKLLVATDVAARGIDVTGVSHVVNYSCPEDDKTYVHRIGRTGRAGATGIAITFVDWADVTRWKVINKALDLPFDEPAETYSSSEHFFHDQGIPPGVKGRIAPEKPREEKKSDDRGARSERSEKSDRPRRNRSRSRTRGGEPVDGDAPAKTSDGDQSPSNDSHGSESGEGDQNRPRRRRRRRSGSSAGQTASASSTAGE